MSLLWSASQGDDRFATRPGLEGPSGDMRLVADESARRSIQVAPGWSWMPADQMRQDGTSWAACPRQFLKAMVERLAELDLRILVGFELEWALFRDSDSSLPLHRRPAFGASTFPLLHAYFSALIVACSAAGIEIEQIHPEHGPGQVEASLPPAEPLAACDETVLFRLLAATLAEERAMRASFSPQPLVNEIGNGHHLHFSIWQGGANLFGRGESPARMRPGGEAFLAGVLQHLPGLTALGVSSPASFARLRPSQWAGAFGCWGRENREAALRLEGSESPNPHAVNVEWKSVDPTANPYLAVGGLIAAGIDGLASGLTLPMSVLVDPARLNREQQAELGIFGLPTSLEEATEALRQSTVLREAMGEFLHGCVVAVRAGEAASSRPASDEDLLDHYRFRY